VEWVDDQRVVLARKENWWGAKLAGQNPLLAAYPDTIIFIPIPDQTAAFTAIKDGSVDVAAELDSKQFVELRETGFVKDDYNFFSPPTYVYFYTALNNRHPKLSDKRVRRALAHCMDMDAVIKDLYDGLAERQVGPFFPDKSYFDQRLKPIGMNLDSARQLLADAGWKDTNNNGIVDKVIDGKLQELKLQYLYSPTSNYETNYTELFKNNAQKAGIEIERIPLESNVVGERLRNGDYEVAGRGARGLPVQDDPRQLWHTDSAQPGGSNYSRFGNAASDALIESIATAPDEATRAKLYQQFQQLIYDEQPVIFQLCPMGKIVVNKRFDPVVNRLGVALAHLKLK
jgi:peptide/nickel transport system substrate-binding protein